MLRYFFLSFILISICIVGIAGLRYDDGGSKMTRPPLEIFPDMDHQAKFQPQHPTSFFADGRAARQPVTGTIPLGYNLPGRYYQLSASNRTDTGAFTDQPDYLNTGKIGDVYGDGIPRGVSE
jgi:hypothetical protein